MKLPAIIIFTMLLGLTSFAQERTLKDYRWENRIVIVNTVNVVNLYNQQKSVLFKDKEGLKERKIQILKSSDFKLPKSIARKLEQSDILLIGLDGGVKDQRDSVYTVEGLFVIIDGMPMRQSEIKSGG